MKLAYADHNVVLYEGDIETLRMDGFPQHDAVWTDPPWNPGVATSFRRYADPESQSADYAALMMRTVELVNVATFGGWVQYSSRRNKWLKDTIAASSDPAWVGQPCMQTNHESASIWHPERTPTPITDELAYVDLIEACIRMLPQDAVILDPFMGYGGLVMAARRTGQAVVGIELDPKRIDVAARHAEDRTTSPVTP